MTRILFNMLLIAMLVPTVVISSVFVVGTITTFIDYLKERRAYKKTEKELKKQFEKQFDKSIERTLKTRRK